MKRLIGALALAAVMIVPYTHTSRELDGRVISLRNAESRLNVDSNYNGPVDNVRVNYFPSARSDKIQVSGPLSDFSNFCKI